MISIVKKKKKKKKKLSEKIKNAIMIQHYCFWILLKIYHDPNKMKIMAFLPLSYFSNQKNT